MLSGTGWADPVGGENTRAVTKAEDEFIEKNGNAIIEFFPTPGEKWDVEARIARGAYESGEIDKFRENFPLNFRVKIKYHERTGSEIKEAEEKENYEVSLDQLQQKMMEAVSRGDMKEMERINEQMAAIQSGANQKGMEKAMDTSSTPEEAEVGREFKVVVEVNSGGETIGKQFEHPAEGTAKSFKIERSNNAKYKYYMGNWDVSEADARNWSIRIPKNLRIPGNHLRLLNLKVTVSGDKDAVNRYMADHFPTGKLKSLIH